MNQNLNNLKASLREELGKGPSRRTRMEGMIPAVLYARGQNTLSLVVDPRGVGKILLGPYKRNSIIELEIDDQKGKSFPKKMVMVKERQIHPVQRDLIHVDFVEIDNKKPINVSVPVVLFGKSQAVVQGGKLDHVLQKIRISCMPKDIPEKIEVDISDLGFGSTHASEIKLPAGAKLMERPKEVLLTIKKPRGSTKEEEAASAAAAPSAAAEKKPAEKK